MSRKRYEDGSVEISGKDLAELQNVSFGEHDCIEIANMAARRVYTKRFRDNGLSWSKAKAAAKTAKATPAMQVAVTDILSRGGTIENAIQAGIDAA